MLSNFILYNSFRLKKFSINEVFPEPPEPDKTQINPL